MFQLLFLGSLFSALLTVYILILKRDAIKAYADYLLALTIIFFSWSAIIYLLLYYNMMLEVPLLFKTAAPFAFAIPPLSYLYTRAVLFNEKRFQLKDILHCIPFVIILINYVPFFIMPIEDKRKVIQLILENLDLAFTYQAGIIPENIINSLRILILLIYTIAQWRLIIKYKKSFNVVQVENQIHDIIQWLKIYAWSCTAHIIAIFIIAMFFLSNNSLFNNGGFINLIPLIIYSVSFFVISSYLLIHPNVMNGLPFIKYKEVETNVLTEEMSKIPFIEEDYSEQIKQINQLFEEHKPYLNKDLSLVQVAASLDLPIRDLSYILNNYYNLRFTDFVNQHRINHIISIYNESYLDNFTIESAALEAGFMSKSGFYKSFKKLYKMTPTAYFQSLKP